KNQAVKAEVRLKPANMRFFRLAILLGAAFCALPGYIRAQQIDVAFGVNALNAPSASDADSNHQPQSLTGGAYPSFSADAIFYKNLGVQGEFAWRASRADYQGVQPDRPMFYDFNAIYAPKLAPHVQLELLAGIGAQATRFYQPFQICDFYTCKNYV